MSVAFRIVTENRDGCEPAAKRPYNSPPMKLLRLALLIAAGIVWGVISARAGWFPASLWGPLQPRVVPIPAPIAEQMPGLGADGPVPALGEQPAAELARPARTKTGKFYRAPQHIGSAAMSDADRAALAELPYMQGVETAPEWAGVVRHDPARAHDGVNLVLSGHGPEATVRDMQGQVLHTWRLPFEGVWPGPLGFKEYPVHKTFWRRVHAFPDGSLLAIFEGIGMVKVDADSQIVWKHKGRAHHDISVASDGTIYTLSHHPRRMGQGLEILDDFVLMLSPEGEELRRVSVYDAFAGSPHAGYLRNAMAVRDPLHTNTAQLLDGRLSEKIPAFAAGNVLISLRNVDTIAVLDMRTERIVWAMTGMWGRQHQPQVLENGNVLLFDNVGDNRHSRVLELDPATQQVVWSYAGSDQRPFASASAGSCQRLGNGNTLVVESVSGRAFEVTPEGDIVWEFVNPERAGPKRGLIAVLYDVVRLPADYFEGF